MKKAIIYARAATHEDAEEQYARCGKYADLYGFDVVRVITCAGFELPGIESAIDLASRMGADAVIAERVSAIVNSVHGLNVVFDLCKERGVTLVTVHEKLDSSTAGNRLMLNMFAITRDFEREAAEEARGMAEAASPTPAEGQKRA